MVTEGLLATLGAEPDITVLGVAGTVADAYDMIRARRPDVVLMDHYLPDGEGLDVAERIRGVLPATKIVVLTSAEDEAVLLRAIEIGCSGYVTKGTTVQQLADAVRAAAAGEALVSGDMLARLLPRLRTRPPRVGADLTRRETEVLELLAAGTATSEVAAALGISVATTRNHIQSVLSKLGAHSKLEAVSIAVREGIVRIPS
jgi:DNA-binding NarL/FixJ family response regulator